MVGGGGSEISGYGIKRANVLDHYTGLDMIFLTELKGHKGIKKIHG